LVDLTEFNANTSTTSAVGVVQLQDSATDGTTDKAITPNAVYDISGVLQTNMAATGVTNGALIATNVTNIASTGATNAAAIAAKDNYQYWTATDGNTTSNISTTEDVKITGAGQVTVSLASGSPSVFTVSGEGAPTDAQYVTLATDGDLSAERVLTAGSGIRIVDAGANGAVTLHGSGISLGGVTADLGSTDATPIFNLIDATGYLTSRLVGDIDNSQLANSSITVTAATGLAVVGSPVSLGGTITLATAQTGYFMKLGINDTTPDAMVDIVSDNDSTIGLIIQAAPSQSENMIETRLFDGETRFTIAQNGNMECNAITATGTQIKLGSVNTSPTIRVAAGGNNLNIRNLNADKDINLDIAESGNFVQIRTYLGGTASTRVQWEDNGVRHDKASSYGDIFAAGDASTVTFDLAQSNVHIVTLGGSRTLAIASGNAGQKFMIRLTQDGAGGRSGIWFSAIRWAGGSPPVQGESANKSSLYGFLCTAGGYYDGFIIGSGII
jgi:hypothetical protein